MPKEEPLSTISSTASEDRVSGHFVKRRRTIIVALGVFLLLCLIAYGEYYARRVETRLTEYFRIKAAVTVTMKFDSDYDYDGLDENVPKNLLLKKIDHQSLFFKAGLRDGDRVLPADIFGFYDDIVAHQGRKMAIKVLREDQFHSYRVEIPQMELRPRSK